MQRALCNASADEEDCGHLHICACEAGHKGVTHICKCGAIFMTVKVSELNKPLQKVQ
jgi:hypothetical protein